jgi:DNA-binding transcriptional regulator YiaG
MKEPGLEVEKALDRVVFGTNDPKRIDKKLTQMEQYLELENSSLGHSLAGIRHRHYWSLETGAEKAGVPVEVLRDWESDTKTPSPEELKAVLKSLRWSWDLERFMALREKAGRVPVASVVQALPWPVGR